MKWCFIQGNVDDTFNICNGQQRKTSVEPF